MPKVSVYLPDDLYDEVRRRELPLSQLAQQAVRDALARSSREDWAARMRERAGASPGTTTTEDLMEAVAEELGG